MKFLEVPVLFDSTPEEDIERAESMGIDVDRIIEVDNAFIDLHRLLYFNDVKGENETTLVFVNGISLRVALSMDSFVEKLKEVNEVEVIN